MVHPIKLTGCHGVLAPAGWNLTSLGISCTFGSMRNLMGSYAGETVSIHSGNTYLYAKRFRQVVP